MESKKSDTNKVIYKTAGDTQTQKRNIWLQEWIVREWEDKLGVWD